jgi:hypothetical protein
VLAGGIRVCVRAEPVIALLGQVAAFRVRVARAAARA